ncbi:hypothetical protein CC86DRAFT_447086 [Ophiobolus disseminans]|uniref:Zn(2)-C6 fungal-type domain-containing protein n=1 Tax=Ophiobolus disseminans TaxID=1469910 RepID=A0A6A6ZTF5_9PLEO|nr:hypothetical protein CC86DRAFT_447086 [Ophiobolus disseminans]
MPNGSPEGIQPESTTSLTENLACNGCRKSKLRCSRDRPNCLHCRKTGLECVYETKRVKPGLKAGAVENLHRRLDDLEQRLDEQVVHARNVHTQSDSQSNESTAYTVLALLAAELPKLLKSPANAPTPTFIPPTQPNNKRRRLDSIEAKEYVHATMENMPPLPHRQLLGEVVTAYFRHVHPWIPMIHQGKFLRTYVADTEDREVLIVLQAMIVSSSKFIPGTPMAHTLPSVRRWVVSTAMDHISLGGLQALIIVAFDDIGSGNTPKAWSIVGSLTRTVEYAQLAQEHDDGELRPFCPPYASLRRTSDWTELEERRRVFWNVFLLDRFCSVTMGWNTSLTSHDVYRRLPCDGHLWRKQNPVQTPYLGIWDKSRGRIGNPIGYASRFASPSGTEHDVGLHQDQANSAPPATSMSNIAADMSTVGAFAYNIEATESMSRIMSYFLQQKINVRDSNDINSWLTRFKELDLRLVHWKMLLPQKWKANPNLTKPVELMDPNLTTAHVTHNASMILLHQIVAYPLPHWGFRNRLPSACSAEACYSAGVEIASITEKYVAKSPPDSPVGNQYGFCLFIAARVLLAHWRYTVGSQLPTEFWSLVQSLDEMSRRWMALSESSANAQTLFSKYSNRLRHLYDVCLADQGYQIDIMDHTIELDHHDRVPRPAEANDWSDATPGFPLDIPELEVLPSPANTMDLNAIPQMMLDQDFMDMDRVIAFDDGSMFAAAFEPSIGFW